MTNSINLDEEKLYWLRGIIRKARNIVIGFALLCLLLIGIIPIYWTLYTYIAFGVGYTIAIVWNSLRKPYLLRISANPNNLLLSEEEVSKLTEPFWRVFKRRLFWLPVIPIFVVLIILNPIIKTIPNPNPTGLFLISFVGFAMGVNLCWAVYSNYLLRVLDNDGTITIN